MIRVSGFLIGLAMLVVTSPANALGLKMTLLDVGNNTVEVTLTNESFVTQTLLRWESPFESELTADAFLLVNQSDPSVKPDYSGKLLKRGELQDSDFFTLQPGEEISNLVKLTDYYDVDLDGTYQVTAAGHINAKQLGTQQLLAHTDLLSNTVSMQLTVVPEPAFARTALLQSCSADQQSQLSEVIEAAETMAVQAKTAVDSLTTIQSRIDSPRLTAWFGQYDDNRFNRVTTVYSQVVGALSNEQLTIKCDCPESFNDVYAFVFPNRPYEITVCPVFWRAPLVGSDSKAGTVIHELTHFTIVGDTDDHAYGAEARRLAITDPNLAVDNAESYEYFAENTPQLDLIGTGARTVESASGQVSIGVTDQFTFSGSGAVTLISNTGDADLQIFRDGYLVCESANPGNLIDECELTVEASYVIEVIGYSDSNYELQLERFTSVTVQSGGGASSGGSGGGGGFFGTTSLLSLLAIAALRCRRRFNFISALTCGFCIMLLTACQAPGLHAENGAATTNEELKPIEKLTQLTNTEDASAILKLVSPKNEYSAAEQVDVVFSLHNNSDKPIEYLPWGTPLEGQLTGDVFAIEFNGAELAYMGPVVKRRAPVKADHDIVQPGEKREIVVNVANSYDMTLPGSYTINWREDGALAYQFRGLALAAPESIEILRNP